MQFRSIATNAALVVISTVLSFGALEFGYRFWLYYKEPHRFRQHDPLQDKEIPFISPSPWTFNAHYGFDYPSIRSFVAGTVVKGKLASCVKMQTNSVGAWNSEPRGWDSADIRVLVVGDSMTAMAHGDVSWTDIMGQRLAALTGKSVAVRNLGRDGQGILQMLDIAASELPKLRPNLLVIAYITDDLTRARIWRRNEVLDGKLRNFVTIDGDPDFDPKRALDTEVVLPEPVSIDWCRKLPPPDRSDPIIREIEARYGLAVAHANSRADLFTLRHSLAFDTLVHGDAFYYYRFIAGGQASFMPRHSLASFDDDLQTAENLKIIRASGVPIALFHIAIRKDLKRGREFTFAYEKRDGPLLRSLEAAFGVPSIFTQQYAPSIDDIDKIAMSPDNDHPSRAGMDFYGETAARAIADLINGTETGQTGGPSPIGRILNDSVVVNGRSYPIVRRIAGCVESKSDLYRSVEIAGWAADYTANAPAKAILAAVDNEIVVESAPTTRRPDIEQGIGSGVVPAGFKMIVPVTSLRRTPPTIRVFVLTEDGRAVQLCANIPDSPIARLERSEFPSN